MHIVFILGPSGAGKSTLAEQLAARLGFLFCEIDQFPADGIGILELRREWDEFLARAAPDNLLSELVRRARAAGKAGAVVAFPSTVVLSPEHLRALRGKVRVAYLTGTEQQCRDAFLDRERRVARGLDASHWERNNKRVFEFLKTSEGSKLAVNVFTDDGARRKIEDIEANIMARTRNH
jgi:adenylate kinase family enzyme